MKIVKTGLTATSANVYKVSADDGQIPNMTAYQFFDEQGDAISARDGAYDGESDKWIYVKLADMEDKTTDWSMVEINNNLYVFFIKMAHKMIYVNEINFKEFDGTVLRTYTEEPITITNNGIQFTPKQPEPVFVKATLHDIQDWIDTYADTPLDESPFWILDDCEDLEQVSDVTDFSDMFRDGSQLLKKVGK